MCSTRSRSWPASMAFCRSSSSLGQSLPWSAPPMHLSAQAAMMPSGVPPMPSSRSTPVPSRAAAMAPATSPSVMNLIRAPASRTSCDQVLVPGAVEDADGDVAGGALLRLGDAADVLGDRRGDVDDVGGGGAGGELLHVEDGRRVVHRAAVGDGHDGDRVGHALGHQRGAVDRVDGDVALRARAVADLLAVVEHRGLVLLALADDDDAVHADGADQGAHRVDRRAVAAVLVAAADPAAGGHGGGLGDPDQLEGEVAVGRRPVGAEAAGRGRGPSGTGRARDLLIGHRRWWQGGGALLRS